ncbi:secretory carrier-associated membrane protein 2-like [Solanum dulcamara]|uniref:secretory carrier-associated membrane protein 2-like n=1 Tax=Solanum dulcamara TaxID=45834 RepID=UPI002484E0FF|nr:secretory carrier-associated membrane protein 2-like [Solanum dulcamara]
MAGRYNENPFAEEANVNPFANGSSARGSTVDIPLDSEKDLKKKEKELQAKEADLRRREQEVRRREEALAGASVVLEQRNWPPFLPIIHHDIANEIPIHLQKMQYVAFTTLLGLAGCTVWNCMATTCVWIKGGDFGPWFFSLAYLLGVPSAYFLWYRPLYRAMRTDSALNFGWFFVCYAIHVVFCVLAAVAPPFVFRQNSMTGFLNAITLIGWNSIVGILYFIGAGFFTLESVISICVIQQVFSYFRGSGQAAEMKKQAARSVVTAAM